MAKTTAFTGIMTACLLLALGAAPVGAAPPTVADILTFYKPDFPDVQITTPTPDEYASCDLKWIPGARPGTGSYVLQDAKKQILRRYSITGGKAFDTWSYFKDGVEVFRELDTNFNGRKDQYRWLNTAGMKWGFSSQEDGKVDAWQYISAEEAAQELFAALSSGDVARMQALLITEAEMRTLKLPAAEAQRMLSLVKGAPAKFQATRAKLPQLDAKARFVRMESATPNCVLAETNGTDKDQLRFPNRAILFESGDKEKKHDWLQTGEMIKVGMAWRLIDGPSPQDFSPPPGGDDPALQRLLDKLAKIDGTPPAPLITPKRDEAVQNYNLERVAIIEKILELVKGEQHETFTKQVFDNLSAAYQAGHVPSLSKLAERRDKLDKAMPGSNLAAYGAYRHLWALYAEKITGPKASEVQEEWLNQLVKFVQAYPKCEDAPDALWLLAMGSEYGGKDEEAKRWYHQIYENFPTNPLAAKARGSEARLNLIGHPLQLSAPQLGSGTPFNITSLKGKVVVVYYWASHVNVCERDFDTLKRLRQRHGDKMELVCVSLDDTPAAASAFLQRNQVTGIQLFEQAKEGGGLNSPLAAFYGINGLPHLFLVGRDGNVINRTLQVGDLETALRNAL
jgi:thiol-disulfide isomerase/thioredoxin